MKGMLTVRNCIITFVLEFIISILCSQEFLYQEYYYGGWRRGIVSDLRIYDDAWMYFVFPILAIGLLLLIYDFHNIRKCKSIEFLHEKIVKREENVKRLLESNGITNCDFSEAEYLGYNSTGSYMYEIAIKIPNLHKWEANKRNNIIDCIQKQNGCIYEALFSFAAELQFVVKDVEQKDDSGLTSYTIRQITP